MVCLFAGHIRRHFRNIDFYQFLQANLEQQCVVSFVMLLHFLDFFLLMSDFVQSHHMAEILEERASVEVIKRDEAIENYKKECQLLLVANNERLREEAEGLRADKVNFDSALSSAKAAEELALERAKKATDIADTLRREVDAERASAVELLKENGRLRKELEEAKTLGLAAAKSYTAALAEFGGVTPALSPDLSVGQVFGWMAGNFSKLPTFVGKVGDFAALSCATNFAKTLTKASCGHVDELKRKKDYEGPASLGGASKALMTTVRHFMEHFCCKFGR